MHIVILGAGQVGASVAESLVSENNDITVVDSDHERLAHLQDRLDLQTVVGNAAHPSVLANAGLRDADLLIAVTQSDQTNLVACKVAHSIFNVPARIARLRARDFLDSEKLLSSENFAVDYALCPEQVITEYIARLVDFPEALQVLSFGGGRLALVAVRAYAGGLLVGRPIKDMSDHLPAGIEGRIAAIFRRDGAITPTGETIIEDGDEVFLLAAEEHIRTMMRELRRSLEPVRRVMIAGGGNIGLRVAQALESKCEVKVVELDRRRAEFVASALKSVLVLSGDATDEELLQQEAIDEMDLFLALTNDDEDNIMAGSLAKRMGSKRVVALINRRAYAELVQGGPIDIAISPAQVSIGTLLTYVRHGDVAQVHSLRRGAAEALEIVAHGEQKNSKVVGRRIGELPEIAGAFIAAIVRDLDKSQEVGFFGLARQKQMGHVLIAHKDVMIESGDHVIVFCLDKKVVKQVEKLFAVGFHFF
ncbi:MAG TPA: Trk system potassium transporter TrkA [Accumulibacter sp.]|uniref:Trk system potassium uptake protein TrkA n=3 Tax=Betaproteobacteria incertae sedis TaxID=119066 RepID=A0A080M7T4_9PROT|nr:MULTISPECIES: Trk system potassium transporter TrkA [Candidatus Accumulibacter]KFB77357.1 MAG: Trk system potassium uptake protein TrkA [Candidatus Accumulibacter cognatus]MBL8401808.1 Trk system potassium transporter TrkA [Accumulibacter sp.]MBN8517581.1 Trk system potassium transporter TrkA [Accumulibacter sp.]MBO3712811.1 Trk system potassium transporter TrkA [Accumulibacter sp.]MCM8578598.1 Trk system potassium transporter TrkA [Accumulibacter sp.]